MNESRYNYRRAVPIPTSISKPFSFVVTDPRDYDGNPYEVAERAVRQAEALARITAQSVQAARLMARNAQMERDLHLTGECFAPAYDESAEGRRFDGIMEAIRGIEKDLKILTLAAGFDPKRPLNA